MDIERLTDALMAHRARAAIAALAGVAVIAAVDFLTGVEYRVYPLYFLPLSLAAWYLGRRGAIAFAVLCAGAWVGSNYSAGLHYSASVIWGFNVVMQATSFLVVGLLIATLRGALAREAILGRTDALTSLLNRRAFYSTAEQILAIGRRYEHPVTLAYLDLDGFKAVNDTLGHEHGDATLRQAAELLKRAVRTGDVASRFGGDEFVVLLPETGFDGARALLERLRAGFAETFASRECPITVSIGAATFTLPPLEVEELVRVADEAMYAAKSAGKNRVSLRLVTPSSRGTPSHSRVAPSIIPAVEAPRA